MSNVILTMIGWGLFYWVVYLCIFWVLVERAFFAGSDPECWDPNARVGHAPSDAGSLRPLEVVPSATPLRRAA